jgi:subtilase family serine protease
MAHHPSVKTSSGLIVRTTSLLTLVFLSATVAHAADRKTLHTEVPEVASHLQRVRHLPANNQLRLAIGLPLRDMAALSNLVQQIYSPASTNFHRYLTPEQFAVRFGPTEQDYQAVIGFAQASGLEVVDTFGNRAVLDVAGKAADIERAFSVTLGVYRHPTEDREFYTPEVEPSVSAELPVLYISGLDNFVIPRPSSFREKVAPKGPSPNFDNGSGTGGSYAGLDFRTAYVPGVSLDGTGQFVGLVEFTGYTPSDITKYATLNGIPTVPLRNVLVDGVTNTPGQGNVEVAVDIELVMSMLPGIDHINVYEGTSDVDVLNEIASPTKGETLPYQVSCSWGIAGDTNLDQSLIQMAAQGQSIFYASGDSGAPMGGTNGTPQIDNYMTSVGGTALSLNGTGGAWQLETVWSGSYGAVDTRLPIPDYQKPINMAAVGGSNSHRNIPDVAMEADFVEVVYTQVFTNGDPPVTGHVGTGAGTSAAAPLWAAFTAMVNQQAASQGKPTMGFINPAIYDIAQSPLYSSCFHDITIGNTTNKNNTTQFYAATGYDLCTGWGSPNGINLIHALVGFTGPVFVDFNYTGAIRDGNYDTPFKTMVQGTNAVSPWGTIFIKTAGSSSETMTIRKPMTITAIDGPGTIGR